MAKWEAQFNQMMNSQREDDLDYGGMMQNAWESMSGDLAVEPPIKFNEEGLPILGPYPFGEQH